MAPSYIIINATILEVHYFIMYTSLKISHYSYIPISLTVHRTDMHRTALLATLFLNEGFVVVRMTDAMYMCTLQNTLFKTALVTYVGKNRSRGIGGE